MRAAPVPSPDDVVGFARHPAMASWTKRGMDVVGAALFLLLSLPVLLVAVVAIRVTSPGPAFFTQQRVGAGGRPFTLVKLRTMTLEHDESEHRAYVHDLIAGDASRRDGIYKLRDDPRRTRVGGVLRRTSIDELPQLLNVLAGHMSLVGPRPSTPEEVEAAGPGALRRLDVRPGLAGLWQVSGRSKLTHAEMIELDLRYVDGWDLATDLKVLLRTPAALLRRETA